MSTTIIADDASGSDRVRAAEAPHPGEATRHFGSKSRNAEVWVAHAEASSHPGGRPPPWVEPVGDHDHTGAVVVTQLWDRAEGSVELEQQQHYLRRQNENAADPDRSFEEKLHALVELGCERFGLGSDAMAMVDPERTDRTSEVFKRLHDDDEYSGAGIGLSLCQEIVDDHGGDIWIESEPGGGSTVFFTLPRRRRMRTPDVQASRRVRGDSGDPPVGPASRRGSGHSAPVEPATARRSLEMPPAPSGRWRHP